MYYQNPEVVALEVGRLNCFDSANGAPILLPNNATGRDVTPFLCLAGIYGACPKYVPGFAGRKIVETHDHGDYMDYALQRCPPNTFRLRYYTFFDSERRNFRRFQVGDTLDPYIVWFSSVDAVGEAVNSLTLSTTSLLKRLRRKYNPHSCSLHFRQAFVFKPLEYD
jgi:hypothetical protein